MIKLFISAGIPLFYPPDRGSSTVSLMVQMALLIMILPQAAAADELLLDDSVLKDIEKNAKKIAENLDYMLDNLRYSLHAVSAGHNSVIHICII